MSPRLLQTLEPAPTTKKNTTINLVGVLVGAVDAQAEADVGAVGTTTMMIDETMVVVVVVGTRVDLVREEEEDDSRMNLEGRREMGRESLSRTTRGSTRDHRTGILVGLLRLRRGIMGHHRVDMVDHRHRLLLDHHHQRTTDLNKLARCNSCSQHSNNPPSLLSLQHPPTQPCLHPAQVHTIHLDIPVHHRQPPLLTAARQHLHPDTAVHPLHPDMVPRLQDMAQAHDHHHHLLWATPRPQLRPHHLHWEACRCRRISRRCCSRWDRHRRLVLVMQRHPDPVVKHLGEDNRGYNSLCRFCSLSRISRRRQGRRDGMVGRCYLLIRLFDFVRNYMTGDWCVEVMPL